jgi:hypothetical protein
MICLSVLEHYRKKVWFFGTFDLVDAFLRAVRQARGANTKSEKIFFSEEKKQKTFMSLSRSCPAAHARKRQKFWFFYSKKELPCFTCVG